MVSQLYLMWASLLNTLEAWMKRHRVPSAAQDANLKKLKHRHNNNWHPALPLAFLLDPLYAQTANRDAWAARPEAVWPQEAVIGGNLRGLASLADFKLLCI